MPDTMHNGIFLTQSIKYDTYGITNTAYGKPYYTA